MTDGERITGVEDVPADSTFLFTVDGGDGEDEAVLTRSEDGIEAYVNRCMHFTHIRIDKGSGAPVRDGELVCANHGAMFEQRTGVCTFGPCEGAKLDRIEITVADGDVYLVDDDYAFVATGGVESDPSALTSTSNVEF